MLFLFRSACASELKCSSSTQQCLTQHTFQDTCECNPTAAQCTQEGKTTSSKTVVVCSHCKSRGHSRRTCPQLQTTADSTTDSTVHPSQLPVQQDDLNQSDAITNGAGRTVRLFKGSQTLPSQQDSLAGDEQTQNDDPVTDQDGNVDSGSTASVVSSQDEAAEAGPLRSRCSYCGGTGHNARTCAKLAAARQEEEDAQNREVGFFAILLARHKLRAVCSIMPHVAGSLPVQLCACACANEFDNSTPGQESLYAAVDSRWAISNSAA